MSKIDDLLKKQDEKIQNANVDIESTKWGRVYKKSKEKYDEYKNDEQNLTEEQKKELKKYYISQTITILIALALAIFLIVRIIQINM